MMRTKHRYVHLRAWQAGRLAWLIVCGCLLACTPEAAEQAQARAEKAKEGVNPEPEAVRQDTEARFVVLGGTVAEIISALGGEQQIVGADMSSKYPPSLLKRATRLDYYRRLSPESVLALKPDVVFMTDEAGPPGAVEKLAKSGVTLVNVGSTKSVDGARARIRQVGKYVGTTDDVDALVTKLDADLKRAEKKRAEIKKPARAIFIYARGQGMTMVLGKDTPADRILTLAGAVNVATFEGIKPLNAEAVVDMAPEVLVMPAHGAESVGGGDEVFKLPGLAETPAGRDKRLVTVDDLKLLGFGPRLGEAVLELMVKIHPELATNP